MKILIKVTKAILAKAKMCGYGFYKDGVSRNCAIALAVREWFPDAEVTYGMIITHLDGREDYKKENTIHCSQTGMSAFISKFDGLSPKERLLMPEFSFEIDVPMNIIEQIGIREAYKVLSESKTLELVKI